ncbi:MAG: hypothetical protein R6U89_02480 [Dehalococcoidia bacterium]
MNNFHFPILSEVLRNIIFSYPNLTSWKICPILTDQEPRQHQDTRDIIPLLVTYLQAFEKVSHCFEQVDPMIIEKEPHNYNTVLECYEYFRNQLEPKVREARAVLFNITTGTPAMSFAAGQIFATNPRISFLYSPWNESPKPLEIKAFHQRVKANTLDKVRRMLARYEFQGAADVLESEDNGFREEDIGNSLQIIKALAAWKNYDFTLANKLLKDYQLFSEVTPGMKSVCERLSSEQDPFTPDFWQAKLQDVVARMEGDVYSEAYADLLVHLHNFHDVSLQRALNYQYPNINFSENQLGDDILSQLGEIHTEHVPIDQKKLYRENDRFHFVYWLNSKYGNDHFFKQWFEWYEIFRWFKTQYVDEKRHELIHTSLNLQRAFYDNIIGNWITVPENHGPRYLLALVRRSLPDDSYRCHIPGLIESVWSALNSEMECDEILPDISASNEEILVSKLEESFGNMKNREVDTIVKFLNDWKDKELSVDIERLTVNAQMKQKMKDELEKSGIKPLPQWNYLIHEQGKKEDAQKEFKVGMLTRLHPCLQPEQKKTQNEVRSALIAYLKNEKTLEEVFRTYCSPKDSRKKSSSTGKAANSTRKKPGSQPKNGERKEPLKNIILKSNTVKTEMTSSAALSTNNIITSATAHGILVAASLLRLEGIREEVSVYFHLSECVKQLEQVNRVTVKYIYLIGLDSNAIDRDSWVSFVEMVNNKEFNVRLFNKNREVQKIIRGAHPQNETEYCSIEFIETGYPVWMREKYLEELQNDKKADTYLKAVRANSRDNSLFSQARQAVDNGKDEPMRLVLELISRQDE